MQPPSSGLPFSVELRNAREAEGLTTAQLGARLGVHSNVISYWENETRTPSKARQAEILERLRSPSRTMAELVAELQREVSDRIARFAVDVETLQQAEAARRSAALAAAEQARPGAGGAGAARPRRRTAQ